MGKRQSGNIARVNTVSDVLAYAIEKTRAGGTYAATGPTELTGNFDKFIFSGNPANKSDAILQIDGQIYRGCQLLESGDVSVPNANFDIGEDYEVTEYGPFFFDGHVTDLNAIEMAMPAIILPRPQQEQFQFGDANSFESVQDISLAFVDFAEHEKWRSSNYGIRYSERDTKFNQYIEKPLLLRLKRLINELFYLQLDTGGGQLSTIVFEGAREGFATYTFVPKFGYLDSLKEYGFDENYSGYTVRLQFTIKNSICAD